MTTSPRAREQSKLEYRRQRRKRDRWRYPISLLAPGSLIPACRSRFAAEPASPYRAHSAFSGRFSVIRPIMPSICKSIFCGVLIFDPFNFLTSCSAARQQTAASVKVGLIPTQVWKSSAAENIYSGRIMDLQVAVYDTGFRDHRPFWRHQSPWLLPTPVKLAPRQVFVAPMARKICSDLPSIQSASLALIFLKIVGDS